MSDILKAMIERISINPEGRIAEADIVEWIGCSNDPSFFNQVSLEIAQKYNDGKLTYEICDRLINNLWEIVTRVFLLRGNDPPEPYYEVFLAFDSGEFYRKSDRSDDPVAEYTNPMIADLLLKFSKP